MPEDVLPEVEFVGQVADAYEHLYDPVYFRTHPLTDVFLPDPSLRRKEKAWQLHRILVGVIEELDPGPQAPVFSHEWRRHRLMVLHYLDGLDPQTVADQLAISRRHYYREHESAIEAVASILWSRYVVRSSVSQPVSRAAGAEASPSRLELLRLEAARMAQSNRYARVGDVVPGVLSLLQEMLRQHGLDIHLALPETLPGVPIDQGLLRQVLLGIWDLLQVLLNQPDTHHIPIIVCSVLKQKELALLLGATAFLEKPVTEQALLSALVALEKT